MDSTTGFRPGGHTTVEPWVVTDDTRSLIDFVVTVFDGQELARVETEDGAIGHGEVRIGDTVVLAFDRQPDWPPLRALLRVWVPDADAVVERAVRSGSAVVTPPSSNAFGQRGARIRDPFGNLWWVETQVENVPPEEMWQRLGQPGYAEDMQIAQQTLDAELSGRAEGRSSAPIRS